MTELRIATFNALHGKSINDGQVDPMLLGGTAKALDADILGLQEMDRFQTRSGMVDQTRLVAEALEARNWRFLPAVHGTPGRGVTWRSSTALDGATTTGPTYGIGLVSRYPVQLWRVRRFAPAPFGLPLLVAGERGLVRMPDEPRQALAAVIKGPRGPMTVVNAHLSFVPGYNVSQLRRLVSWVADLPSPRFLIGDFNLPGTLPRGITRWNQLARVTTYPSHSPRVQFDHVLSDRITTHQVLSARSVRMAVSDHRALVVDLSLR